MIELVSADQPDVLCLQELPVWSLVRLEAWSGLASEGAVARAPLWPIPLSAWITRLNQGFFRSAISGQANAILVRRDHTLEDLGKQQISERGRERRVCQAARVGGSIVVANLHASNEFRRPEVPRAELERARAFAEGLAGRREPVVLAGDFNLCEPRLQGYSPPGPGIDHVLVRGANATPVEVWPVERRMRGEIVLSDHPPVELRVE
jgi:endonuclease/exonuclease/phosphatase family metal-dependent hydrolase